MNIKIQILEPGDLDVLTNVAPGVFDRPVAPELAAQFLNNSHHHMVVAIDDRTVVGMASAIDYIHPDKPLQLWINEVGVASEYQGKGIGKQLISSLLELARDLGCYEAWVATEPDNKHARKLYESTGGQGEQATIYIYDLSDSIK